MPNPVRAIPEGYHSISPSSHLQKCHSRHRILQIGLFGATEVMRMPGPEGKIMHSEAENRRLHHFSLTMSSRERRKHQPLASRLPCSCSSTPKTWTPFTTAPYPWAPWS